LGFKYNNDNLLNTSDRFNGAGSILPNISDRFNGANFIEQKSKMIFSRPKSWFSYYEKEKQLQICTNRLMEMLKIQK
jgi:hypothetical protein